MVFCDPGAFSVGMMCGLLVHALFLPRHFVPDTLVFWEQIRLIVAHPEYNHSAHFEMKSENAETADSKESGAVWSHVEKYARDYCSQDPDIELILHTTAAVKELFMIRLPEVPRWKICGHVKTWMVCCLLGCMSCNCKHAVCYGACV